MRLMYSLCSCPSTQLIVSLILVSSSSSSSSFYVNLSTLKRGLDVTNNNFLLHKGLSCASFSFNPHSFMSFVTHSIHVFLPLPFFFTPPTISNFLHLDTQSSANL